MLTFVDCWKLRHSSEAIFRDLRSRFTPHCKEAPKYAPTLASKIKQLASRSASEPHGDLHLSKDREPLLAFYDFPAEHWKHLRTTNPIESTFATVRHRTVRSRGCLSNKTTLAMIYKLAQAAEKSWNRLRGHNQFPKVIVGVKFNDGIEVVRSQAQAAAA
jgi:transposase-like protein